MKLEQAASPISILAFIKLAMLCSFLLLGSCQMQSNLPAAKPALPENFIEVGPGLYSGAVPDKAATFLALAQHGVRTVISVDGLAPEVALAQHAGLRMVHIPIGYGEVPRVAQLSLARVLQDCEAPYFVYCHHGVNRGPAMAAMLGLLMQVLDASSAQSLLQQAGTGTEYPGLWQAVSTFKATTEGEILPALVEQAPLEPAMNVMVGIGRDWRRLRRSAANNWQPPKRLPQFDAKVESLLLAEKFHELARAEQGRSVEFVQQLQACEAQLLALSAALRRHELEIAKEKVLPITEACDRCHHDFR